VTHARVLKYLAAVVGGLVAVLTVAYLAGFNPVMVLNLPQGLPEIVNEANESPIVVDEEKTDLVEELFGQADDVWSAVFTELGAKSYPAPMHVEYSDRIESPCGLSGPVAGAFYCPSQQKIYIDLAPFNRLGTGFGTAGNFARAYIVAHEVGHHLQLLLGALEEIQKARGRSSPEVVERTLLAMELQADCYAGVWAARAGIATQILQSTDPQAGLAAASKVGEELVAAAQKVGARVPDSLTHGNADQRMNWFRRGFDRGDLQNCNTFTAAVL